MKKSSVLVLVLCVTAVLFTLSFRAPLIFTENVYDYEWNTSTVLRHLQSWHEQGALNPFFVPSVSYDKEADKHINNHSSIQVGRPGYFDHDGNYYYVSYPPFAYIAPYLAFKITGIEPNVIGVRLFNLATQIATATVLLALLYRMTRNIAIGFLGFLLYLFLPISLYMHTANYMSDMFVQFFFALSAYLFYVLISSREKTTIASYMPLGITLFLMLYTEWIGIFVCAFLFLYALIRKRSPHRIPFLVMSMTLPALTLAIVFFQYVSVADVSSFVGVMFDRYTHGYVPEEVVHPLFQLDAILKNYWEWFAPTFLATILLGALVLLVKKVKILSHAHALSFAILSFLIVPVLFHHTVFFDWTAFEIHFFSVLKTTLFFCVLIPLLVNRLWLYQGRIRKILLRTGVVFIVIALCMSSLVIYADEIEPQVKKDALEYCNLGTHFKLLSAPDEVLFLKSIDESFNNIISSIIILCAHRNVELYTTEADAEALIRKNNTDKAVVYTITYVDGGIRMVKFDRIRLDPATE